MLKQPIFKPIFGASWDELPVVFRAHYANRGFSADRVTVEGELTIEMSGLIRPFAVFLRLSGTLPPYAGTRIPATVHFDSERDSMVFCFNREIHYPDRPVFCFKSRMEPDSGNSVTDYVRSGIGWHTRVSFDGKRVQLRHMGYRLKLFGRRLRLPLGFIFGRCDAWEESVSEDQFRMRMEIRHPLWGRVYAYHGEFRIRDVSQHD